MGDRNAGDEGRWLKDFMESRYKLLKSGYQSLDTSGTGARARIWQQHRWRVSIAIFFRVPG